MLAYCLLKQYIIRVLNLFPALGADSLCKFLPAHTKIMLFGNWPVQGVNKYLNPALQCYTAIRWTHLRWLASWSAHQAFNSSMCELPVSQVTSLLESQMDDIHELWHFGTMMNKIHCLFQRASCSALLLVGRGLDNPDGFE